jgi:hypothetical protein
VVSIDGGAPVPLKLIQGGEYAADLSANLPFGEKRRVSCVITADSVNGKSSKAETSILLRDKPSTFKVQHVPVSGCKAGEDLIIKAVIDSSIPLRKAKLHYSYVNQFEEMRGVDLKPNGNEYQAIIPGSYIITQWDLLYYFELVDELGSGIIYPDFREQTPYWVVNTRVKK